MGDGISDLDLEIVSITYCHSLAAIEQVSNALALAPLPLLAPPLPVLHSDVEE